MRSLRLLALAALAVAQPLLAPRLPAQPRGAPAEPARPRLGVDADTNDARAFYQLGRRLMERSPAQAADAFYWATRLSPDHADAYYARRIAILLARRDQLLDYWRGTRKVRESPEVLRVDSLALRALALDPLHGREQDARLLRTVFETSIFTEARRRGASDVDMQEMNGQIQYLIDAELSRSGPAMRGMMALGSGRPDDAIAQYREALRHAGKDDRADVLVALGRTYAIANAPDSALAMFERAVADLRARDRKTTVLWYDSKAMLEHSIGMLHERMGRDSAAREAYGRALQEDLAYHPAHVRLSRMALARGDTAQGVSEIELAVQLREHDGLLHFLHADALVAARRPQDAQAPLERAIALEPHFAPPYLLLARLFDAYGLRDDAARRYQDFVARSRRSDPQVATARERLAELARTATPVSAPALAAP
jgi:tetratricopeptide (TPR) repeat protein